MDTLWYALLMLLARRLVQEHCSGQGRVALLQATTGWRDRILKQAVGVGLVAPALPQQQESSPQQIRLASGSRTREAMPTS